MPESVKVSDMSWLIALDLINILEILHQIFPTIYTTPEVREEFGKSVPEGL